MTIITIKQSTKIWNELYYDNRSIYIRKLIWFGTPWLWSADKIFKCLNRSSCSFDRALARQLKKNDYKAINSSRRLKYDDLITNEPSFAIPNTSPIDPAVFLCISAERILINEQSNFFASQHVMYDVAIYMSKLNCNE